jgi:hypothetical protein
MIVVAYWMIFHTRKTSGSDGFQEFKDVVLIGHSIRICHVLGAC